jgi:hypothetical protein
MFRQLPIISNFNKMKFNIIKLLFIAGIFSGCQETISLDLNSSDPQIVVEASVPTDVKAKVILSKSVNFNADNTFPMVQNATITLTDDIGNSDTLTESLPGIYYSKSMVGVVGRTYSISIQTGDKTITSTCKIPNPVRFDSISVEPAETFGRGGFGGGTTTHTGTLYTVKAIFKDPASETNYYRFVEYVNGISTGRIYVYDDRLTNGIRNEKNLLDFNRYLNKGDVITIEMQCIDKSVYEYFNSFGNSGMGTGTSTPANPYSNLTGNILGYFSAYTVDRKKFVIK